MYWVSPPSSHRSRAPDGETQMLSGESSNSGLGDSNRRRSLPRKRPRGRYSQICPIAASPPLVETKKTRPSPNQVPSSKIAPPPAAPWLKTARGSVESAGSGSSMGTHVTSSALPTFWPVRVSYLLPARSRLRPTQQTLKRCHHRQPARGRRSSTQKVPPVHCRRHLEPPRS